MDLLLIDDIKHYILIKNINKFISDNSHVIKTCRNCLNVFYSEIKYKEHVEYCNFRKPKKLMPYFKKYMKFENLKNCILNNWVIHSDFECKNMNLLLVGIIWIAGIINLVKKFKLFII